jgi:predicted lipoprotein with Yx(FWY)xxD motif
MNRLMLSALGLATVGMAVAGCGSSSKSPTSSATTATTLAPTTTTAPPSVKVTQNPKEGAILTDNAGRSLYLFTKDTGTTSACTAAGCAGAWPAYIATGTPVGGTGVDSTKLATATGQAPNQVTYFGHLLYYFARDTAPGDVNGLTIPNWFLVGPDGSQVKK